MKYEKQTEFEKIHLTFCVINNATPKINHLRLNEMRRSTVKRGSLKGTVISTYHNNRKKNARKHFETSIREPMFGKFFLRRARYFIMLSFQRKPTKYNIDGSIKQCTSLLFYFFSSINLFFSRAQFFLVFSLESIAKFSLSVST